MYGFAEYGKVARFFPALRTHKGWPCSARREAKTLGRPKYEVNAAEIWGCYLLLLLGILNEGYVRSASGADAERLTQLSLEELGNIKVTSVSKEPEQVRRTPAAIYVITQEDIRRSGATSIPEVLRLAPGVEVARIDSDHWSVAIRGFSSQFSKYVLVLIDGRSVYTPLYAGVYWDVQNVPLDDVDRIEVIRGPGGTIWGPNAVNGVINIITKSTKDTHGARVSVAGGNVDEAIGEVRYGGGIGKNLNYRVYGMGFQRGPERHLGEGSFDTWSQGQGGFRSRLDAAHERLSYHSRRHLPRRRRRQGRRRILFAAHGDYRELAQSCFGRRSGSALAPRTESGSDIEVQASFDRTYRLQLPIGRGAQHLRIGLYPSPLAASAQNLIWGLGAQREPQ